jgi:hypothetical protein
MKSLLFLLLFIPLTGWGQVQPAACSNTTIPVTAAWQNFYDPGGLGGDTCVSGAANNYPNANCETTYRFVAPAGQTVELEFSLLAMFNTFSGWDWMVIHDGGNAGAPILYDNRAGAPDNSGGACGQNPIPASNCSSGRRMFVRFWATSVVSRAGWEARFRACNIILPIELTEFSGDCEGFRWETASEHNCSHFKVESSLDLTNWVDIGGDIACANNQSGEEYYLSHHSRSHLQYYRLTQFDFNGDSTVFKTISIHCEHNYKTPATVVGVYDMLGRYLGTDIPPKAGAGIYLVRYSDDTVLRLYLK